VIQTGQNKIRGILSSVFIVITVLVAAPCAEPVAIVAAGIASIIHTDKIPTNYMGKLAARKQCDTFLMLKFSAHICHEPIQVVQHPIYCNRSLGSFECYITLTPYNANVTGSDTDVASLKLIYRLKRLNLSQKLQKHGA
jgi:hypothetical protein